MSKTQHTPGPASMHCAICEACGGDRPWSDVEFHRAMKRMDEAVAAQGDSKRDRRAIARIDARAAIAKATGSAA